MRQTREAARKRKRESRCSRSRSLDDDLQDDRWTSANRPAPRAGTRSLVNLSPNHGTEREKRSTRDALGVSAFSDARSRQRHRGHGQIL